MKGSRFYKIIIVVLVLLNVTTLTYYWVMRPPHPPKPGKAVLAEQFGLTGEKKKKVDALEIDHHKRKRKLIHKNRELHVKLYQTVGDDVNKKELLEEIYATQKEIEKMTFEFFDDVADQCDEKQKKELKKFINKELKHIFPGMRRKK